jgi:uncharacterized protein YndB with AHSA1/START domain
MAQVTASRLIRAPQAEVWGVISDVANARKWNKSWRKIEFTTPQTHGVGTSFSATVGDEGNSYQFEVSEWSSPERIAFRPIRSPEEGLYPITLESHVFQLREAEGGTLAELTATASAHGILGRIMTLFFWKGHQREGLEVAVNELASIFEPDEDEDEEISAPEALTD